MKAIDVYLYSYIHMYIDINLSKLRKKSLHIPIKYAKMYRKLIRIFVKNNCIIVKI